jgi:hypothetical protein
MYGRHRWEVILIWICIKETGFDDVDCFNLA